MRKHFRTVYRDPNFMTPDSIGYLYGTHKETGAEYVGELSRGSGMFGAEYMFGLTVITKPRRGAPWEKTGHGIGGHHSALELRSHFAAILNGEVPA